MCTINKDYKTIITMHVHILIKWAIEISLEYFKLKIKHHTFGSILYNAYIYLYIYSCTCIILIDVIHLKRLGDDI